MLPFTTILISLYDIHIIVTCLHNIHLFIWYQYNCYLLIWYLSVYMISCRYDIYLLIWYPSNCYLFIWFCLSDIHINVTYSYDIQNSSDIHLIGTCSCDIYVFIWYPFGFYQFLWYFSVDLISILLLPIPMIFIWCSLFILFWPCKPTYVCLSDIHKFVCC